MGTKTHNNYEDLITFERASGGYALRPVSYGTELVTNGDDFSSGWSGTGWTFSSGQASVTGNGTNQNLYGTPVSNAVAGKLYQLSYEVVSSSLVGGAFRAGAYSGASFFGSSFFALSTSVGTHTLNFVGSPSGAGSVIDFYITSGATSGTLVIDNVSIKEVTFDQPDGTLTLFEHPAGVPRVEWDSAGNRLGLLVEEARTNLTTISEPTLSDLSNSGNVSDGDFGNSLGLSNGIAFGDNSVTRFAYRSATVSSGQDYVVSVFVKMDDGSAPNVGNGTTSGDFGLVIGSSLVTSASNISVTAMSDNVYRVSGTRTASSTDSQHGVIKYTGQSAKGFTITGFQIEQASFGSSYIKTTGDTATRSADVASIPVADFGFNSDVGSVVVEAKFNGLGFSATSGLFEISETGSGYQGIDIRVKSTSYLQAYGSSGVITTDSPSAIASGDTLKAGLTYEVGKSGAVLSLDGANTAGGSGTVTLASATELQIGRHDTNSDRIFNGHIKSIKYYPRRLTNAQLVELTS